MHDQARPGVAGLAAVVEDPVADGCGRCAQVADIREDDLRALAAKLERDGLHVALADRAQERAPDLRRSRERDLVDIRVAGQRVAEHGARPGHDVEDAIRQAGLRGQLGESQRGQGRLRRGLQDDGVAGGQRGAELPGRDDERIVPGHDRRDDADRLAGDERQGIGPGRAHLAVHLVDRLGVPTDRLGGRWHVDRERVPDRLTDIERLEQRQLLEVRPDQLGQAEEHALALAGRAIGPATVIEGVARCGDRAIDIDRRRLGDRGDPRAIATGDVVERPARCGGSEAAIDEQFRPRRQEGGSLLPIGEGQLGRGGGHEAGLIARTG